MEKTPLKPYQENTQMQTNAHKKEETESLKKGSLPAHDAPIIPKNFEQDNLDEKENQLNITFRSESTALICNQQNNSILSDTFVIDDPVQPINAVTNLTFELNKLSINDSDLLNNECENVFPDENTEFKQSDKHDTSNSVFHDLNSENQENDVNSTEKSKNNLGKCWAISKESLINEKSLIEKLEYQQNDLNDSYAEDDIPHLEKPLAYVENENEIAVYPETYAASVNEDAYFEIDPKSCGLDNIGGVYLTSDFQNMLQPMIETDNQDFTAEPNFLTDEFQEEKEHFEESILLKPRPSLLSTFDPLFLIDIQNLQVQEDNQTLLGFKDRKHVDIDFKVDAKNTEEFFNLNVVPKSNIDDFSDDSKASDEKRLINAPVSIEANQSDIQKEDRVISNTSINVTENQESLFENKEDLNTDNIFINLKKNLDDKVSTNQIIQNTEGLLNNLSNNTTPESFDEKCSPARIDINSGIINEKTFPNTFKETRQDFKDTLNEIPELLNATPSIKKMAELSEKVAPQHEEMADLKLKLNASQQVIASLELQLRQKEEIIIKCQAEELRKEQSYKQEIKQLKDKLDQKSLESESLQNKELQETVKVLKSREIKLLSEINQRKNEEQNYRRIMEEYENTIGLHVAELQKLNEEHETVKRHLANLELAFSDVHQKYERSKKIVDGYKCNEDALRETLHTSEDTVNKSEEKYESLKAHAKAQIEKSNQEMQLMRDHYETEIHKLSAITKRLEIKNASLTDSLDQKTKECIALAELCDEVTGKV